MAVNRPRNNEPEYNAILDALTLQKQKGKPTVLNIHIAGTGNGEGKSLAGYQAIQALRGNDVARLFFAGVASVAEGHIEPARNNPKTLAKEARPRSIFAFSAGSLGSDLEVMAENSDTFAYVLGGAFGTGESVNTQRIMHALERLEKDGALPEEVFLSGYSRGAVNCVSIANAIYIRFGMKIKTHLCLVDPVPGPTWDNVFDVHVIPPNTISLTAFYANQESKTFYGALDLSNLVISNHNTAVTSYAVPGTHGSIHHSRLMQIIVHGVTFSVNREDHAYRLTDTTGFNPTEPPIGSRKNSVFTRVTPINDACSLELIVELSKIHNHVQPWRKEPEMVAFGSDTFNKFDDAKSRASYLLGLFENLRAGQKRKKNSDDHNKVDAIKSALSNKPDANQHKDIIKIEEEILNIIKTSEQRVKGDASSAIWGDNTLPWIYATLFNFLSQQWINILNPPTDFFGRLFYTAPNKQYSNAVKDVMSGILQALDKNTPFTLSAEQSQDADVQTLLRHYRRLLNSTILPDIITLSAQAPEKRDAAGISGP